MRRSLKRRMQTDEHIIISQSALAFTVYSQTTWRHTSLSDSPPGLMSPAGSCTTSRHETDVPFAQISIYRSLFLTEVVNAPVFYLEGRRFKPRGWIISRGLSPFCAVPPGTCRSIPHMGWKPLPFTVLPIHLSLVMWPGYAIESERVVEFVNK
jgi:hypothetical protein